MLKVFKNKFCLSFSSHNCLVLEQKEVGKEGNKEMDVWNGFLINFPSKLFIFLSHHPFLLIFSVFPNS